MTPATTAMRRSLLFLTTCLGIAVLVSIDWWQGTHWRAEQELELRSTSKLFQTRLENSIYSRFNAVEALSSLFVLHPGTKPDEFASFSSMLLRANPAIRALQYADSKTRVIYTYPPKGNEVTIRKPMVLLSDPQRGSFTQKTITQKSASVQGPFELRQGGIGLVVRSLLYFWQKNSAGWP